MKTNTTFFLLIMALGLVSCNEKVSPELQNGNSSLGGSVSLPSTYYFEVKNTSAEVLGYKMHKTGTGNMNTECRISNNSGFSTDEFDGNQSFYDISCFLETDESKLFLNGFDIEVAASKNTCDTVGYVPFGFFDRIPGSSTSDLVEIKCSGDDTTSASVATKADPATVTNSGYAGCDSFVDVSLIANREDFQVTKDEDLCRFNYPATATASAANCDEGVIDITTMTYTDDGKGTPTSITLKSTLRKHTCGGLASNCVAGPYKSLPGTNPKWTSAMQPTEAVLNKEFSTKYSYKGPHSSQQSSNRSLVNYRRDLASTSIDFVDSTTSFINYVASYAGEKDFTPIVMDHYSYNLLTDGVTPLISNADIDDASTYLDSGDTVYAGGVGAPIYKATPFAADPFLGLSSLHRVSPFYTFYCLDKNDDIKARIRLVVREFDRGLFSNSNIELLSDIGQGFARQDENGEQIPSEPDTIQFWNDVGDWDDHIPMARTAGGYAPATTIWSPYSSFFNSDIFTNGQL